MTAMSDSTSSQSIGHANRHKVADPQAQFIAAMVLQRVQGLGSEHFPEISWEILRTHRGAILIAALMVVTRVRIVRATSDASASEAAAAFSSIFDTVTGTSMKDWDMGDRRIWQIHRAVSLLTRLVFTHEIKRWGLTK